MDLSRRFTATTTLIVNVMDSDDLDPEFAYEEYTAKVKKVDVDLSFVACVPFR